MNIKHSIIMITFNQEKYIRKALDSVLNEIVKPFEIIIGDDFSTDGTRSILIEYKLKYPDIVKLVFNENNVGIFSNLNKVTSNVNGDIITFLAGDDWFMPRFLENMNTKIMELNLNPNQSRFMLLPNVVLHKNEFDEHVVSNSESILYKHSVVGSVLRKRLLTTNSGISQALFKKWPKYPLVSEEIGVWSDFAHHIMHMQYCDKLILMNFVGPVYRVGVGVSSKISHKESSISFLKSLLYIQNEFNLLNLKLEDHDMRYLLCLVSKFSMINNFSIISFVNFIHSLIILFRTRPSDLQFILTELINSLKNIIKEKLIIKKY